MLDDTHRLSKRTVHVQGALAAARDATGLAARAVAFTADATLARAAPARATAALSPGHPGCAADTISDETVKVGSQPSTEFVTALKTRIASGSQDN
jgi:hypothetical protein